MADNTSSVDFLAQISSFGEQMKSTFKDVYDAADDLKKKIGTDLFDPSDAKGYLDALKQLQEEMEQFASSISGVLAAHIVKDFNGMIATVIKMFNMMAEDIEAAIKIDQVTQTFKKPFEGMFDSFTESIKNLPAVGNLLYDHLDIPSVKEKLESNLAAAFSNIGADGKVSLRDLANATKATFMSMASVVGKIAKTIFLNPWILAAAAITYLIKKFVDLENEAEAFRQTTGQSYQSSLKLTQEIENSALSARIFGVQMQDAFNSAAALINAFGNAKLITGKIAVDLAVLSKTTGITEEHAAGVYKQFAATNGATSQSAADMANTLAYVSQLIGVPMDDMFADIAQNGEFIATYMGKTGDGIIKAAAQARLLGLNMKDVADITSSIMDFEGSIERELMASILVGKQINFNRARYLAFHNDIAGATEEVMRQVGSLEDFNNLSPIAAKSLADAAGLTVEQLRNSLLQQELINTAEGQYKEDLQKAADIIAGRTKLQGEELKQMQREAIINQGALTEMKNAWAQIGASLAKIVMPAMQGISSLLKVISGAVLGLFNIIDGAFGTTSEETENWYASWLKIGIALGLITIALIGIKVVMGAIGDITGKILGRIGGGAGGAGGAAGKGGGLLGKLFGGLSPTTMLAGAASILIISGAIWVFAKALQEFQKNDRLWETLGAAILGLTALTIAARSIAAASVEILYGSLVIGVLAGALWLLGKAINEFVPYIKTLLDGIANIADIIGKTVVNIINAVADSIAKIGNVDAVNLLGVASGITAVGLAFGAFGGGSIAAGFGSFIGNFLGGDPIEKLKELSTLGPGLMAAAAGIQATRLAMEGKTIPINATPEAVNLPVNATTSLNETIANGDNLIIEKLNTLIDVVNKNDIYIDSRKVNTSLGRNNYISKIN